jgi:DNA-directed RNA polymerase subunit M/transcription elongation factor TFIIS
MPLPKLEANKYPAVIPSTNKTIEFRPFLVKEEKILMIAQESKDPSQIFEAMQDIIKACTFDSVDASELTTYDLEYLFLQLRAKSVGETANIKIKCEECDEYNEVSINLLDAKVEFPKEKVDKKIQLSDTVGIIMRPITIAKSEFLSKKGDDDADALIHTVIASIESIYDDNGVYQTDDTSEDDLKDFVESLSRVHLELIQKYLSAQPKLKLKVEFKCSKCGHDNVRILEGLESFF